MAEVQIVAYPGGVRTPTRLELGGTAALVDGRPSRFSIDWLDGSGEILLHFNPRPDEDAVVLNSLLGSKWGQEVVIDGYPLAIAPDASAFRFDVLPDCFRIFVDGQHLCDFHHRRPPARIAEVRTSAFLWRLESARPRRSLLRRHDPSLQGRAFHPTIVPSRPELPGRSWTPDWVSSEERRGDARPLDVIRLFAVLGTWMEEDVVAATVANCFAQGCERVYLVDNESPDWTVERAVGAGAILARVFPSEVYDEGERVRQMRAVAEEVSSAEPADHIWWLFLDADEFYHGPHGLTVLDYLSGLDRRFRIVGARFFNHLPGREPAYVEGRHPLDFQPLCYEARAPYCDLGHWRHPLLRWDRGSPAVLPDEGFHTAECDEQLVEPAQAVFFHHFPFRAEAATRKRLATLFGGTTVTRVPTAAHVVHLQRRLRSLDAVYAQCWKEMPVHPPCPPGFVPELRRWEEWVEPADRDVLRWY